MTIEIRNVSKNYNGFVALKDINLRVPAGGLTALLGPSGSGKTTLLRIIAGLEAPDAGTVLLNGSDAAQGHIKDRQVGFVFQHYALFKHMDVFENIAFGLQVKKRGQRPAREEIKRRVDELLHLVQLEGYAKRYPSELSGGQRQRVALARALAVEPRVLLLDEPFGALDAKVRAELRRWLRRMHDELHVTSVFVTHDQEEALEVADRVVVMNRGRIEQEGTPQEVYDHPATSFVFTFLGTVNVFHARSREGQAKKTGPGEEGATRGYARPHELELTREDPGNGALPVSVERIVALGATIRVELKERDGGAPLEAELSKELYAALGVQRGENIFVRPKTLRVFVEDYQI